MYLSMKRHLQTLQLWRIEQANVWRLALAQALSGANNVVMYATGAIVGNALAPTPLLATLPISIFVIGMAMCVLPAGAIARHFGRRSAFMAGTACGILTGLLSVVALLSHSFWLYCVATFFGGAYAAVILSFRFAATDALPPEKQPQALSLVMAGGVFSGVVGPQLVTHTMHLWSDQVFLATFIAQALVAALAGVILLGVRSPKVVADTSASSLRLFDMLLQPRFVAAVICGSASYLVMNFLMTSAPLAMHMHGHSQEAANTGIQWHVIAMYAPSFFTGKLITRFGANTIAMVGIGITALSALIGFTGSNIYHFYWLLILLGIGWNFGFLGASSMLLALSSPGEETQVQSFNDFIIFGLTAVGSLISGGVLAAYGWNIVLWLSFIPLLIAIFSILVFRTNSPVNKQNP